VSHIFTIAANALEDEMRGTAEEVFCERFGSLRPDFYVDIERARPLSRWGYAL
jgi:hypothetical protein